MEVGTRVKIHSLTSEAGAKLNGIVAEVRAVDPETGRLCLRVDPSDPPDKWKKVKRENLAVVDSKPKSQGGFLLGDKAQEEAERELQRREEQSLQEQKRLEKAGLPNLPNPVDMVKYIEAKKEGKPIPGSVDAANAEEEA
jgi:hypothetical protein